jgi:hypothetical protein
MVAKGFDLSAIASLLSLTLPEVERLLSEQEKNTDALSVQSELE